MSGNYTWIPTKHQQTPTTRALIEPKPTPLTINHTSYALLENWHFWQHGERHKWHDWCHPISLQGDAEDLRGFQHPPQTLYIWKNLFRNHQGRHCHYHHPTPTLPIIQNCRCTTPQAPKPWSQKSLMASKESNMGTMPHNWVSTSKTWTDMLIDLTHVNTSNLSVRSHQVQLIHFQYQTDHGKTSVMNWSQVYQCQTVSTVSFQELTDWPIWLAVCHVVRFLQAIN